jgi:hypothetical protein
MRRDLFVYLSGPITAKRGYLTEENVASALRVFIGCIRAGLPAFCPQLTGAFPSAHADVPYEAWMAYDFAVIDRCTHMVMLPRWESSDGAVREREYALQRGMPVLEHTELSTLLLARLETV